MKGFKDTTRVQYFRGGQVTREKACGGMVKKAEGGRVTDPVKNKTGGKSDPEYGDYAISKVEKSAKPVAKTTAPKPPAAKMPPMKKAEGGKVDMKQDKKTVAAGVHKHERNMHPGKPLTKMQRGGLPSHNRAPMIKAK